MTTGATSSLAAMRSIKGPGTSDSAGSWCAAAAAFRPRTCIQSCARCCSVRTYHRHLQVALKKKHPEHVFLLVGNRDLNKLRYAAELAADDLARDPEQIPNPHWSAGRAPPRPMHARADRRSLQLIGRMGQYCRHLQLVGHCIRRAHAVPSAEGVATRPLQRIFFIYIYIKKNTLVSAVRFGARCAAARRLCTARCRRRRWWRAAATAAVGTWG